MTRTATVVCRRNHIVSESTVSIQKLEEPFDYDIHEIPDHDVKLGSGLQVIILVRMCSCWLVHSLGLDSRWFPSLRISDQSSSPVHRRRLTRCLGGG